MKFYRWFERRLSGKKHKAKSRCKDDNGNLNEHCTQLDTSRANRKSKASHVKSGQISIQKDAAFESHRDATPTLGATILLDGEPLPSSLLISGTPSLGRQRSRTKTNPWLRSPWLQARSSFSTSSASTDSGCITINNDSLTITAPNSLNFGFSSDNSIDSQQNQRSERNPVPCSSSDEYVSSASSSSVFSSRSSSISSEAGSDEQTDNWSTFSGHPSVLSLVSSEAIPHSSCSVSQTSSFLFLDESRESVDSVKNRFEVYLQREANFRTNNNRTKYSSVNKRRFLPLYSKYCRFGRNEEWVSMATDLISLSSSDEEDDYSCNDREYVPSPAPPEPTVNANHLIRNVSGKDVMSREAITWNLNLVTAAADKCGTVRTQINHNHNNNNNNSDKVRNISSPSNIDFSQFTPISPLTADSGLGLSEGSISTTPSSEVNTTTAETGAGKVTDSRFETNELCLLSDKVKRLRFELKSIVNVAINEAREEEMRIREERLAYLREMIEYKRLLLIQSLHEMRHRIDGGNALYRN